MDSSSDNPWCRFIHRFFEFLLHFWLVWPGIFRLTVHFPELYLPMLQIVIISCILAVIGMSVRRIRNISPQ